MTTHAMVLWAAIWSAATAAGVGLWWLIRRERHAQRAAVLERCLADARLLFPLDERDIGTLRQVATRQRWSGLADVLNALSVEHAGDLPGAIPRKVGAAPAVVASALSNTRQIERRTPATVEVVSGDDATWRTVSLSGKIIASTDAAVYFEADAAPRPLREGAPVRVMFRRDGDACYEFRSFLSQETTGPMLKIRHPDRLVRMQDREYARAPISRLVEFGYLPEDELADGLAEGTAGAVRPRLARGLLVDLSGGGAAIRSNVKLSSNDLVMLSFDTLGRAAGRDVLPGQVVGRVVQCTAESANSQPWWLSRVRFVHISEEVRRCVVRFVDQRLVSVRRL